MAKNESKTEMGQAQENTKAPAYTAQELADGCGAFHVPREVVVAALKMACRQNAAESEAKEIIEEFLKKEVN